MARNRSMAAGIAARASDAARPFSNGSPVAAAAGATGAGMTDVPHSRTDEPVVEGHRYTADVARDSITRRLLVAADLLATAFALTVAVIVVGGHTPALAGLLAIPAVLPMAKVAGLYDRDDYVLRKATLEEAPALLQVAATFVLLLSFGEQLFVNGQLSRSEVASLCGLMVVGMLTTRRVARRLVHRLTPPERCLLLGDVESADLIGRSLTGSLLVNATIVGRVPLEPGQTGDGATPVLGSLLTLGAVLEWHEIDRVLIAPREADSDQILDAIRLVKALGAKVSVLPRLFHVVGSAVEFDDIDGLTLLGVRRQGLGRSSAVLKRGVDVTVAAVALLLLAPVLLLTVLAVKATARGPALARRRVLGASGSEFQMLSFNAGEAPRGPARLARLVQRAALHALPQLYNVLRGEMSLVGPRPIEIEDDVHRNGGRPPDRVLAPGMTGLWRILGPTRLPPEEVAKIEYLYSASWSLWLDIRILLRTIPAVFADPPWAGPGDEPAPTPPVRLDPEPEPVFQPESGHRNGGGAVVTEHPPSASTILAHVEASRGNGVAVSSVPGQGPSADENALTLTAIVPATDSPATVRQCIEAIRAAESSSDELMVVERAPHVGAAEARNYGAARANGDVLVFVDADVVVHEDALRRIRAAFQDDADLTALFGSYDDGTDSLGRVGTFRNLLHHHVHHTSAGPATTFWTGLGAVRRDAFLEVGGFDPERFSLEDVDLGMRLSARGAQIRLDPGISGTHLKDWSLWEMVRTDLLRRGMPWVSLLIGSRAVNTTTLNLSWRHRLSTLMSVFSIGAALRWRPRTAAGSMLCVVGLNQRFYRLLGRRYGVGMATLGVGLHLVHHLVSAASVPAGVVAHAVRRPGSRGGGPKPRGEGLSLLATPGSQGEPEGRWRRAPEPIAAPSAPIYEHVES